MEILHQDAHLVAVNKPAGLLVHRTDIDRHETRCAMRMLRDRLRQRVYPVHRLDKPTAGVLLFALDPETAKRMTAAFAAGAVEKTYIAVVRGHTAENGIIDYALVEEPDPMTDGRARPDKPAQPAVTLYQRVATTELPFPVGRYATARYSLLRIRPRTGRKHQIRRHLKHIFHPVIGDTRYGDGRHNHFFRSRFNGQRLLLAATGLGIVHPYTGEPLALRAALDEGFRNALSGLNFSIPE